MVVPHVFIPASYTAGVAVFALRGTAAYDALAVATGSCDELPVFEGGAGVGGTTVPLRPS